MKNTVKGFAAVLAGLITIGASSIMASSQAQDNQKSKTRNLTVTEYGYTSDQWFVLSKAGLEQCLDKMAAALARKEN